MGMAFLGFIKLIYYILFPGIGQAPEPLCKGFLEMSYLAFFRNVLPGHFC